MILTTDAAGRVYVGSLAYKVFGGEEPRPGNLYMSSIWTPASGRVSDGIMLTNGLGFSPDGRRLYHSDARADLVRVYDVTAGWIAVGHGAGLRRSGGAASPTVSRWPAMVRSGLPTRTAAVSPCSIKRASHLRDIAVPLPMVTSLCFAGDDLQDLYTS